MYNNGSSLTLGAQPGSSQGPEGDFTEKEIASAKECNFVPVSLGSSRLRTETAGIFAAAWANGAKEEDE